jgi:hypothetical protein
MKLVRDFTARFKALHRVTWIVLSFKSRAWMALSWQKLIPRLESLYLFPMIPAL